MIGPLGFAARSLRRRGLHSYLALLGLTLTVATTTLLLLLGQDLASRLGVDSSMRSTFGISWLIFAYLFLALGLIGTVGLLSASYLVSSMISQRIRDIGVIKAAGALPRRLLAYVTFEALVVIVSSCLLGAFSALLIYASWSWPSVSLFKQVGPIANAGATVLILVPLLSFLLSYLVASFRVRRVVGSSSVNAISRQLSNLDLKTLGKSLRIKPLGSAFNLATRNVSRDSGFNRTLLSVSVCICLSMIVLSGALVASNTSASYVVRAMPPNVLIVANSNIYNQYVGLGESFSRTGPLLSSIDYTNASYIITPQNALAFRSIPGVETVDTRLITMGSITGYIKAHFASNQDTGENINTQIIPEIDTGTTQALIVGINSTSAVGDWYTSNGFLGSVDAQYTMIAGDSLVGNIVQMPLNLSQVSAFGYRYDVKSALVDPLNAGRVLYAPVQTVQLDLGLTGFNVLLLRVSDPAVLAAVSQLASSFGLVVGSEDPILTSNLAFLNSTWSHIFLIPILAMVLTCGILLSYLATNFSRRFNDYVVLKVLGANVWYRVRLLLWESWGVLAISMLFAMPVAWAVAIFLLVPDPSVSVRDLEFSTVVAASSLSAVSFASAAIYSRKIGSTTVKDLKP